MALVVSEPLRKMKVLAYLDVSVYGLEQAERVLEASSVNEISIYNPSRLFRVDDKFYCLARVEKRPYSATGKSTVWLCECDFSERNIRLTLKKLIHNDFVCKVEDPWVQIVEDRFYVSVICFDGKNYWQEFYRVNTRDLTISHDNRITSLPMGVKGTRFYPAEDKVYVFVRPPVGSKLKDLVSGREFTSLGNQVGYHVFELAEFDFNNLSQLAGCFRVPPTYLGNLLDCGSQNVWVGINDVAFLGNRSYLVYHSGTYVGSNKHYKGYISELALGATVEVSAPLAIFERKNFGSQSHDQLEELFDVVYPSSVTTLADNKLLILFGLSDTSIGASLIHLE
ncbi:MAG: hypothetical protein N2654_00795 [Deltaproteobacteria bacterium]|nr:hypothetical protein [Deltaproteobacteria bacterium]